MVFEKPVSQQQADILDAWRSGQFDLWAQLEPLVDAAITKRFVACASGPPTENEWAQLEPLINAVITKRLIAFHAAILRGSEIPELKPAKADCTEEDLKEEALKRAAEVWFTLGMKTQCP